MNDRAEALGERKSEPGSIVDLLAVREQTVATCESLTAGLAAATIADTPGASQVLLGGLITYATEMKRALAGVHWKILRSFGPVSPESARAMAAGVRVRTGATWGLALTGVAGPDPVTEPGFHEVGEVWVGIAGPALAGGAADPAAPEAAGAVELAEELSAAPEAAPQQSWSRAWRLQLVGDRAAIRRGAVAGALDLLWEQILAQDRSIQ